MILVEKTKSPINTVWVNEGWKILQLKLCFSFISFHLLKLLLLVKSV